MDIKDEYKFYLSLDDDLKKNNYGKFILIKDQKVVGIFESEADAYREAVQKFGEDTFFIHQILPEEFVHYNTFSLMGLI